MGTRIKAIEYQCTIKSFRMLTPTVFESTFETDQPLTFGAGQFASVVIPGAGPKGRDLRRAYSIASAPETRPVELCVKIVEEGPGTQYLYKLRPGDTLKIIAPYGDFVYKPKPNWNACFIATGTGIAPFRSMLLSQLFRDHPPLKAYCLLGVRTEDELLYEDNFKMIQNLEFISAVSQGTPAWKGFRGRVTDYVRNLDETFPWLSTDYYLCGHGGMIQEIKTFLIEKGVTKDAIHQEIYYK
jgi:NAD(P)H-flavin reductase